MNERRAHILDMVAESYIRSAHPVASSMIAERLSVSSATVRNDFSALEDEGYLQQPHTSAGRIPTRLGFETYARKFIPPEHLPKAYERLIAERLAGVHGDTLFQRVADVTAELSGYAVVVALPSDESLRTLEIHLSNLSSSRLLAVIVLENGLIRQLIVELEPTPEDAILREAERSLRQLALPVALLPEGLTDIAKRTDESLTQTLLALADALKRLTPPRVFSQGLRQVLSEPESSDPEFVRQLVDHLENPDLPYPETLMVLLEEPLANVAASVPFGMAPASLIIVGPARMRYRESLTIAHGVAQYMMGQYADGARLN
jgi:heat-inducible transcriptional repressor